MREIAQGLSKQNSNRMKEMGVVVCVLNFKTFIEINKNNFFALLFKKKKKNMSTDL